VGTSGQQFFAAGGPCVHATNRSDAVHPQRKYKGNRTNPVVNTLDGKAQRKNYICQQMKRIGLLSDTHGFLDPKIYTYFADVEEIWHAGDVGSLEVIDELRRFKPVRGVFGNIDDHMVRKEWPEFDRFFCEDVEVLITHIGGKPGNYSKPAFDELERRAPKLFICGHSHILMVKMDKRYNMLWMNPGACGNKGFHQVKTLLRFSVTADRIHDLEVIELGKRV
jgi:putative phosphoesterase